MKEKCIEYMDQGIEWRFSLVDQSQAVRSLDDQSEIEIHFKARSKCLSFVRVDFLLKELDGNKSQIWKIFPY